MDAVQKTLAEAERLAAADMSEAERESLVSKIASVADELLAAQGEVLKKLIVTPPPEGDSEASPLKPCRRLRDPRVLWVIFTPQLEEPLIINTAMTPQGCAYVNRKYLLSGSPADADSLAQLGLNLATPLQEQIPGPSRASQ